MKIVSVKGKGGSKAWNEKKLNEIKSKALKSIEKHGFALIEKEKIEQCYIGTGKKWLTAQIKRKLRDMFPQYNITFAQEVTVEAKGKYEVYNNVYIIQPTEQEPTEQETEE